MSKAATHVTNASNAVEHDDLYGDLDEQTPIKSSCSYDYRSSTNSHKAQHHHHDANTNTKATLVAVEPMMKKKGINLKEEREEVTKLKQEVEQLQKENELLKRNMGTLYRTARLELDRKDGRILELEQQQHRHQ
jgi:predicted RNase H-like nuclease (RuvC/YqgF family)